MAKQHIKQQTKQHIKSQTKQQTKQQLDLAEDGEQGPSSQG